MKEKKFFFDSIIIIWIVSAMVAEFFGQRFQLCILTHVIYLLVEFLKKLEKKCNIVNWIAYKINKYVNCDWLTL